MAAKKRNPPLSIPLDFDATVDGLLRVDPKKLPKKPAQKQIGPAKDEASGKRKTSAKKDVDK